jgi:hypothetical protein
MNVETMSSTKALERLADLRTSDSENHNYHNLTYGLAHSRIVLYIRIYFRNPKVPAHLHLLL